MPEQPLSAADLLPGLHTVASVCSLGAAACFTHLAGTAVQIVQSNLLRWYGTLSLYGSEVPLAAAVDGAGQPALGRATGRRSYGGGGNHLCPA